MAVLSTLVLLHCLFASPSARAQDAASATAPTEEAPAQSQVAQASTKKGKNPKGRHGGDHKETEGTTAPNRFEADTVIKSQYKLDGQPLEVDPD